MILVRFKRSTFFRILVVAAITTGIATACGKRVSEPGDPVEALPAGEPERYSALVLRTVEEGGRAEVSETRVTRSGEKLRIEWSEAGARRAVIWRPDLGRVYLLDLDERAYTQSDIRAEYGSGSEPRMEGGGAAGGERSALEPEAIERALSDAASPASIEERQLPDEQVEGRACAVFERLAKFSDGRVERIKTFRARDLSGLAVRIEAETVSASGRTMVVTERRDIQAEVAAEMFDVPPAFRRVEKIGSR